MTIHKLHSEIFLLHPPEKIFPFFADAGNLQILTPPWLDFIVVSPRPMEVREGALIDYKLRIHGLSLRWRTRINIWEPPHRFVDEQIRGPYRQWIHEHLFEPHDGGTLAIDRVSYAVPFDFLTHRFFVRRDIEKIFAFRETALKKQFPKSA